jgi:flagellar hook assembly protein FlgD
LDESFTPSKGESWKFPIKENEDATIRLINKAGLTVFTTDINGGYPSEWNGSGNSGAELETGYYLFIIDYKNGEQIKGHVTILR